MSFCLFRVGADFAVAKAASLLLRNSEVRGSARGAFSLSEALPAATLNVQNCSVYGCRNADGTEERDVVCSEQNLTLASKPSDFPGENLLKDVLTHVFRVFDL